MSVEISSFLSIDYNDVHYVITILGIKICLRRKTDTRKIKKFINHKVPPKTILVVEANFCHNETILGYIKYLRDLGYNVEVLRRLPLIRGALCRCNKKIKIWTFTVSDFDYIMRNANANRYERVFYNSRIIYDAGLKDLETIYPSPLQGSKESIFVQHHIDHLNDAKHAVQLVLANPQKELLLEKFVVNPHYYGKVKYTSKNKTTNFITVGDLSPQRRNLSLLLSTVEGLVNKGITNFKITVITSSSIELIPEKLRQFFNIVKKTDYKTMYKEMEKADFFLPLLDPENADHQRYIKSGTSGSFQLIYGFLKPCVIHKKFADVYDFSNYNSLVYETNEDFVKKLEEAIQINKEEYNEMQNRLKELVNKIEAVSVKNLKEIIND